MVPQKTTSPATRQTVTDGGPQSLNLVSWNVDHSSPLQGQRFSALISHVLGLSPPVDIIFLQEVGRDALSVLLDEPCVRRGWFTSDEDLSGGQRFTTITLLSKSRFRHPEESSGRETLGPVWRMKYPSRFGRDALCSDIFVPSSAATPQARVRLINVHLDSLPMQPSLRPRQVSVVAALLRSSGRGVAAGDFNPVLPEDERLVQDNGLVDAWAKLRPGEPGFTWGADGRQPFPSGRLDKVAVVGLMAQTVDILHPGGLASRPRAITEGQHKGFSDELVPWSDHSGLRCSFRLVEIL